MRTRALGFGCAAMAVVAYAAGSNGQGAEPVPEVGGVFGETHPYQAPLVCDRAPGSILVGRMYTLSGGAKTKVAEFSSGGNVGACELAIRASRNQKVCVPASGSGFAIRDLAAGTTSGRYSTLTACTEATRGNVTLRTEPGFVEFIAPGELDPLLATLPVLADPALDQAMRDPKTMWYDEASLTFVYQDSFGNPKGLRANRVGYDVGSNASEPDIRLLTNYFQPGKFKLPFAIAAGATFSDNVYALYFWRPPVVNGAVKPVRYWFNRSHWQWVFPVGTVIGEVLLLQSPDDKEWFTFEVRTRVRAIDGWTTGVYRPYPQATDLADAVKTRRPAWRTDPELTALVTHLETPTTLEATTMSAPSYAALFPPIQGALDHLPAISDRNLVKELLTGAKFANVMGARFKTDGTKTTFAASTHANFHVVPKDYQAGMFELSEAGCRKCHEHTSRPLNNLDSRVVLYGEVWGEDEVFTWHPFAIDTSAFSVSDGNRRVNPRLVSAGLVEQATPQSEPQLYRVLPKPYNATYE